MAAYQALTDEQKAQRGLDHDYQYALFPDGHTERLYATTTKMIQDPSNPQSVMEMVDPSTAKTESELAAMGLKPTGTDAHGNPTYGGGYNAMTTGWRSNDNALLNAGFIGGMSLLGGTMGMGGNPGDFVGDIPTVSDAGGTSIYGDAAATSGDAVGGYDPNTGFQDGIDAGSSSDVGTYDPNSGFDVGNGTGSVEYGTGGSVAVTDSAGQTLSSQVADALGVSEGALAGIARGLGIALPTFLGMFGANELGNQLHDIGSQQHEDWNTLRNDRLPFLTQSQQWLAHPGQYMRGPGKQAINSTLRALSVTGNPFGDPFKMEMGADAGLRSWLNAVNMTGTLGTGTPMPPTPTADIAGAQADASGYNALGWGIGQVLNPPPTFADYMKQYQSGVT